MSNDCYISGLSSELVRNSNNNNHNSNNSSSNSKSNKNNDEKLVVVDKNNHLIEINDNRNSDVNNVYLKKDDNETTTTTTTATNITTNNNNDEDEDDKKINEDANGSIVELINLEKNKSNYHKINKQIENDNQIKQQQQQNNENLIYFEEKNNKNSMNKKSDNDTEMSESNANKNEKENSNSNIIDESSLVKENNEIKNSTRNEMSTNEVDSSQSTKYNNNTNDESKQNDSDLNSKKLTTSTNATNVSSSFGSSASSLYTQTGGGGGGGSGGGSNQNDKQQSNCILFYGVTYLGCASVNAPKSEPEITRIMSTLNEQGKLSIEVTMSVPQTLDDKIILYDSTNESIITEYKMSSVLFVVRGNKSSTENSCFAFTICQGDSLENLRFSCHVFRCNLADAVSKVLYSFWSVFNRQQIQHQQQQQPQQQQQSTPSASGQSNQKRAHNSSESSTSGQFSNVATSLLGSLYGIGSLQSSSFSSLTGSGGSGSNSNSINNNSYSALFSDFALKFSNGSLEDQYIFRAILDIKEEDPKNPSNFTSVPKDKETFKLRKNLDKQVTIQIQQLTNQPLEIERCFGVLMCPGRNVSHKDMQLLQTISMGKSGGDGSTGSGSTNSSRNYSNTGYLVSASWSPLDPSLSTSLQVLNEETQKDLRVFMTIAVDLVINGLQDPVRFCIETKARIFAQNEKFWVYQKSKHVEEFYLQIKKSTQQTQSISSSHLSLNYIYSLDSIHSQTELLRKKHAIEHQQKIESAKSADSKSSDNTSNNSSTNNISDDENEPIVSGLGNVSKDCAEEELLDWSDLLSRWRKTTWNERPKGLQSMVRKGIPEALRGEVWQLLAGCNENEKSMNESYRLLLSKESPSENIIVRDINRTFTGHQFFQDENGQQALYKLSKAYSIYDEEVGYCQGLSFLIASLLLHMPEEQAFNLLVKIMYRYEVREIYKTNFESLHLRFFQLENLIREYIPELYEHFVDLNIEAHMYASQWFLTLYTAKFPLYMVFRILDLFLYEGFLVIFSIALSLLKASQRDLLALDFEGVLKYFRVNMPKKYRSEQNFKELMFIWSSLHSKINEKKLKKYEKNYKLMKEAEALKEDPAIRYEKECKKLNVTLRRLEQENDDLANEYIESKIALSKQLEEIKDDYEIVKGELFKYKTDYQNKLNETNETNKKLMNELDQLKQLWRKQSDKYESELERNGIIISEYKQICNTLSNKVEKWVNFRRKYEARAKKLNLCDNCTENNKIDDESLSQLDREAALASGNNSGNDLNTMSTSASSSSSNDAFERTSNQSNNTIDLVDDSSFIENNNNPQLKDQQLVNKVKSLELELARVKLELVDAQCKNQEFDHKFKEFTNSSYNNNTNNNNNNNTNGYPSSKETGINNNSTNHSLRSNSIASQGSTDNHTIMSSSTNSLNTKANNSLNYNPSVNSSYSSLANTAFQNSNQPNANNWLSKTFTQFKEATNHVVQKAQKVKIAASTNDN